MMDYAHYYWDQAQGGARYLNQYGYGGGIGGVFHGRKYTPRKQTGHGFFGKAMSFLGKHIKPIAIKSASAIGKNLLNHGTGFITDLLDGKSAKQAALSHLKSAGRESAKSLLQNVRGAVAGGAPNAPPATIEEENYIAPSAKRARKAPVSRKRKRQSGRGFLFP